MRFSTKQQAISALTVKGFTFDDRRRITFPPGKQETDLSPFEADAIEYLCTEHDYRY